MLIQVDIDSTLYDCNYVFREVGKIMGVDWPLKYDRWFGPDYIGTDLVTIKNLFKKAHSREYVLQQKPYPAAANVLSGIVETYEDIQIAYVSDRNTQQTSALAEWLEINDFLHSEDEVVVTTKDKRVWMRENRPDIVIDDRVRTLLMARFELGSYCATIEHSYNINLKGEVEGVYLVDNWYEMNPVLIDLIQRVHTKVKV